MKMMLSRKSPCSELINVELMWIFVDGPHLNYVTIWPIAYMQRLQSNRFYFNFCISYLLLTKTKQTVCWLGSRCSCQTIKQHSQTIHKTNGLFGVLFHSTASQAPWRGAPSETNTTDRALTLPLFPGTRRFGLLAGVMTCCYGGDTHRRRLNSRFHFTVLSGSSPQHKQSLLSCKLRTSLTRRGGVLLGQPGMLNKTRARETKQDSFNLHWCTYAQ